MLTIFQTIILDFSKDFFLFEKTFSPKWSENNFINLVKRDAISQNIVSHRNGNGFPELSQKLFRVSTFILKPFKCENVREHVSKLSGLVLKD